MSCIDFITSIITSVVVQGVTAVGGLFCAPFYDEIKTTVEAVLNPQSLDEDYNKLKQLFIDIKAMKGSEVIKKWIGETRELIRQIEQLWQSESGSSNHNDDHQSSCLCVDACSRCNLHRNTKKLLARGDKIKRLKDAVRIGGVPHIEDGTPAGRNLRRVMDMLNADAVLCIGVWGPGGVGKTTLVEALYNKLTSDNKLKSDSPKFDLVRLIRLKENDGKKEVQEAIAKSLGLTMGEGIESQICNTLEKDKFVLILDNVWSESIQLSSIGIPKRQKGSKIILTTRSRRVCTTIGATDIEMERLTKDEAWQLFKEKAGEVVNDEKIKPLAERLCERCGRLPLALATVGSAMKGKTEISDWNNALTKLQSAIPIDKRVEMELYDHLKLSYDLLPDDTLKSCFLYCSLYPEGWNIEIRELVHCWIAEKLINDQLYCDESYSEGFTLVKKLIDSCLLEVGNRSNAEFVLYGRFRTVVMHDVVRNTARWIAESIEKKSIAFSGYGISKSPDVELPEEVHKLEWISFVDNKEITLPKNEIILPKVTTLLLKDLEVSVGFLSGFQALRVLNSVRTGRLPYSLLQLKELKLKELRALLLSRCLYIDELPSAENLKMLDLSYSYICKLPKGMEQLTNIKVLNLSCTPNLRVIYSSTIRSLRFLEVLDMHESGYRWPTTRENQHLLEATLQDFSELWRIREIYLQLSDTEGTYEKCMWMKRLKHFELAYNAYCRLENGEKIITIHEETKVGSFILHAEKLILRNFENANEMFANFSSTDQSNSKLKSLEITGCDFDRSSTSTIPDYSVLLNVEELQLLRPVASRFSTIIDALGPNFPKLRRLEVSCWEKVIFCSDDRILLPKLECLSVQLLGGEKVFYCDPAEIQAIAPKLRILEVACADELESLCNCESDKPWICLEVLKVIDCPRLKKLPYMPSIKEIRGSVEWWNSLEWDSEEAKLFLDQRFKPFEDEK